MKKIKTESFTLSNTAVALGKFEGLHRGHQLLFQEIIRRKENGLSSVVFTFDMPPRLFFHNEDARKQLFTKEERYQILENYGVDILIEYPFTMEFASMQPDEFVKDILLDKVGAKVIVVGEDFRFGKKRAGSVKDLQRLAPEYGYDLVIIPKLQEKGEDISSSVIKQLLYQAKMEDISSLLGRNYAIYGDVVHGKALGRTIAIPTANQIPEPDKALPPNGVYLSKIKIGQDSYFGITNIGVKPTVDHEKKCGVETHIFDFSGDIYEEKIEVELLHFLRPEQKFDSLEFLVSQMNSDIKNAKELVSHCIR